MNAIVWCNCLDIYAGISDPSWQLELKAFPWLDEPITRQILKETFTDYASTLSSTPDAPHSGPFASDSERPDAWHLDTDAVKDNPENPAPTSDVASVGRR
jgi:hypothetical protein